MRKLFFVAYMLLLLVGAGTAYLWSLQSYDCSYCKDVWISKDQNGNMVRCSACSHLFKEPSP